jgi:hypothetical protein
VNWSRIDQLLANCSKQTGLRSADADPRLRDYSEFLSRHDGAEGFVGADRYIVLWGAQQLRELNVAYRVAEFAPSVLLIGTDGGDTGFGIDEATGCYVSVPMVGMSREALKHEGSSFEEFLANRAAS